jgi:hypothetical protein
MKRLLALSFVLLVIGCGVVCAQQPAASAPLLTRTTTRREARKLGYASTVTLLGGPQGNVTIEGWNKPEIEITADIEIKAATEDDLNHLAAINGFVLDEGFTKLAIITTGAHDKEFVKRYAKNFPKKLIGAPWRIDYRLKVPLMTDLDVNGGRGALTLRGVEGAISLKTLEGDADLTLTGGLVRAVIGRGTVNITLAARSWRGAGADIQLSAGDLNVNLPPGYNGDLDVNVLRTGQLVNAYDGLAPRERTAPTPASLQGRSGAGGARLSFTVGDGNLRLQPAAKKEP